MESSDAFITEIDIVNNNNHRQQKSFDELLEPVRKEHSKIKEVVESFSRKVKGLVDKQRNEYMIAYENHMQDIQIDLHCLREKVSDIANDDTKNEKVSTLKTNQKKYKDEALKLESDSESLREQIRIVVKEIYSVEKSRDWLLKRLRKAKTDFKALQKERNLLYAGQDFDLNSVSIASISNASSYTIQIDEKVVKQPKKNTSLNINHNNATINAHARLVNDFTVSRKSNNVNNNSNNHISLPLVNHKYTKSKEITPTVMQPWDFMVGNTNTLVALSSSNNIYNKNTLTSSTNGITKNNRCSNNSNYNIVKSYSLPNLHNNDKQKSISNYKNHNIQIASTFVNKVYTESDVVEHQINTMMPHNKNNRNQGVIITTSNNISMNSLPTLMKDQELDYILSPTTNNNNNHNNNNSNNTIQDEREFKISEEQALARLIALRTRKEEINEFIHICMKKSLHRSGPWSRVNKRHTTLSELLKACEIKLDYSSNNSNINNNNNNNTSNSTTTTSNNNSNTITTNKFRDEELLQLVCELATYPETYQTILNIFNDSPYYIHSNYISEDEINTSDIIKSPIADSNNKLGLDPIVEELYSQYSSSVIGDCNNSNLNNNNDNNNKSIEDQFKKQLNLIMSKTDHNNYNHNEEQHLIIDKDLKDFFLQEHTNKHLSNLGFFQKDNFLNFK